jgi:5'-nucleotidase
MRRSWVKAATALAALTGVALLTPLATDDGGQAPTSGTALAAATAEPEAYRLVRANGIAETFGDLDFGVGEALPGHSDIVGGVNTLTGLGIVTASADGGAFAYGDARFVGSAGAVALNRPIVGVASTPSGGGYWLVASDGGIFSFGDAGFYGSTGAIALNQPIVGMAATPTGLGYWLVASDGGIFSFGDAIFHGSTGNVALNSPIVGVASSPSGDGYWIVASDGGVFAFGDAGFHGSTGAVALNSPIVGLASTKAGKGYWLAASDGGIFAFGDAPFLGRGIDPNNPSPVVGISSVGKRFVDVQILGFNDFHGNLEPPGGAIGGVNVGGAVYLSTHLQQRRVGHPNTITVTAGDNIGASPLLSALFHDEPTIEALDTMGVDLASVGNHEFDEGSDELLRMQNGGCNTSDTTTCNIHPFAGAEFEYLAANVTVQATGKTLFPPYAIRDFDGARVAFIGMTLEGTPQIVTPAGVAGLTFADEAATVNALVPQLKALDVESIVVVVHEGGSQAGGTFNACQSFSGDIAAIVNAFDDAVDVVVSGHTHQAYNCTIDGKLVTGASSFGRVLTDIGITVDRTTGDVTAKTATNSLVTRDVTPDPAIQAIINQYQPVATPLANRVVGKLAAPLLRATAPPNPTGEWSLGDFIADSQLFATQAAQFGGAQIAFMNPGGIRATLPPSGTLPASQEITYNDIFTVQPFGNSLVTMTLTGDQIKAVLEQQMFQDQGDGAPTRILQVSQGFTYDWSASAPTGSKVTNMALNATPIVGSQTYRVTVNSFLATGGDGFTVLAQGTDRLGGAIDTDAVEAYLQSLNTLTSPYVPIDPLATPRITKVA